MPAVYIADGRIAVETQFHKRHLVQQIPGARFNRDAGHWTAPLSWATCILLRGIFREQLEIRPDLAAWSWQTYEARIEPALQLRSAMELSSDDPVAQIIDRIESRGEGAA